MAVEAPNKTLDQLQLALARTYLAYERTLMAWIRTAASLITLGFTLYKLFAYLHDQDPIGRPEHFLGARTFGVLMIVIGVLTLVLAIGQHRLQTKQLRAQYTDAPVSLSLLIAGLVATLGVLALLAAAWRV